MAEPEYTKNELLRYRIVRLYRSAETMNGQWNFLLERQIYHLLEINQSPLRALGRYARYIVVRFWRRKIEDFHWYRRWYWYRWVRRWSGEKTFAHLNAENSELDRELRAMLQAERSMNGGEAE